MILAGKSAPLGATLMEGGVNFSVFSRSATGIELVFFDREDDPQPERIIVLDPIDNRTYRYWHAPIARTGRAIQPKSSSIRMDAPLLFRRTTLAKRPADLATTPQPR